MWEDMLISQAVSTVLVVAKSAGPKSKWRRALLKIFKTIAVQMQSDEEFQLTAKEAFK